eukprot:8667808-Ditylum_brightwellii.AAC.1
MASTTSTEEFNNSPKKTSVIKHYTIECTIITPDGIGIERNTWWVELAIDRNVEQKTQKSNYAILGEPCNPKAAFNFIQLLFPKKTEIFPLISHDLDGLFTIFLRRSGKKRIEASRSGGPQGWVVIKNSGVVNWTATQC